MLEHMPKAIGEALKGMRPGLDALTANRQAFASAPSTLSVTSSAFADGGPMPAVHSDDGTGLSPPVAWTGVPAAAKELVLLIEDADSPTPAPLVHAIVVGLPGRDGGLAAGDLSRSGGVGQDLAIGKNSTLEAAYLPPDPPTGHGPHRYAVQVFALDRPTGLDGEPGRGAVVEAMTGHVLAKGVLIGTYERR